MSGNLDHAAGADASSAAAVTVTIKKALQIAL